MNEKLILLYGLQTNLIMIWIIILVNLKNDHSLKLIASIDILLIFVNILYLSFSVYCNLKIGISKIGS